MITFQDLSKRIFQFFDYLYSTDKVNYGFSKNSEEAFMEETWNNNIRPDSYIDGITTKNISTLLFYRIEDIMLGNGIQSNSITYEEGTNKETISSMHDVSVTVNILSKTYKSKDALKFLLFAIQSERKQDACYSTTADFDLTLYRISEPLILTELEKGAWTERVQITFYFKYRDSLILEEMKLLNQPATIDDVKDIIEYDVIIKKEN